MVLWLFVPVLEKIYPLICRHRWIRERRSDGTLGLRCIRCLKRREHTLARLIAWKPDYRPVQQPTPKAPAIAGSARN